MEYSAIFHDMDKRFCYAIDKDLFVIRVQVKKDDMKGEPRSELLKPIWFIAEFCRRNIAHHNVRHYRQVRR